MVRLALIDLSKDGINKFFSPIETNILNNLWSDGEMTTTMLAEKTDIPLTSVAGTVDRLVKAGYVTRHLELINGKIKYFYEPVFSEKEIATIITNSVLDRLVDTGIRTQTPIFISIANVRVIPGMTIIWLGSALVVVGIIPLLFRGKKG